ncbi:energy transducer TonB [Ferrovibrio xuzhouensis]|uniref:Energy transducer TonB n=1 Tax=Ferrovibrio xuzhouensis TaxID=1576914 RepID=A0ABV7VAR6_9PROT
MQRTSYIFSASLHAGILALAVFGLPYFQPDVQTEPTVILAEFAPIAEQTNVPKPQPKTVETKAEPKPEPKPEVKEAKPEPPKPPPAAVTPPPPPPPPTPEPPKKQVEAPKPAPMPEPEPTPKPVPKPDKVADAPEPPKKKVEAPKPVEKPAPPKPQTPPQKSKTPDFADVAALVNKMQKTPPATQPNQAPQVASRTPPASASRAEGPSNPNLPISMSEKDFIRKQVEDNWLFDLGAKDAENLVVRIRFSINPDGTLRTQPQIVDQARMYLPGQESYRAAAESARRAVLKAVPFKLPPGDKEKWGQDIILNFDPRQMLGG